MAKYKAYPEYKDSGVEWLGKMPKHWRVIATKYIAQLNPKKSGLPRSKLSEMCSFIPMEKLKLNTLILDEEKIISQVYDGYTYFEEGDILIAKVTPCFENKNMAVAEGLVNEVGFGSSEIYVLRCSNHVNRKFLFYRLQEDNFMAIAIAAMSGAGGLKRVPAEVVNSFLVGLPELLEQREIAIFLDHETAKIDKLIEKQQQLIELLKEKRQAVISHAVTKGLNPDVPMKDSGVEWLGEIPSHWEMKRLAYLGSARNGLTYSPENITDQESGTLVLRSSNIRNSSLCFDDNVYVNSSIPEQFLVKENDLLICSRNGSRNLIGKNALISKDAAGMAFGAFMAIFRSQINTYIFWVLNSPLFDYQSGSFLTSTINQLTIGNLNSMKVPVPTFKEQKEIVRYLSKKNNDFIELINKVNNSIALLQERRTALISAAVTGKIDVRDWIASDMQDAEEPQETTA
ncbi:TPA: restriction endonuclease subunit S [Serratia marcescens]|nr:restriction endonuclease subunit S [Serratia marcescens]HEJ9167940.1 restriction endonuclease subunit S [Serratia marcescens]